VVLALAIGPISGSYSEGTAHRRLGHATHSRVLDHRHAGAALLTCCILPSLCRVNLSQSCPNLDCAAVSRLAMGMSQQARRHFNEVGAWKPQRVKDKALKTRQDWIFGDYRCTASLVRQLPRGIFPPGVGTSNRCHKHVRRRGAKLVWKKKPSPASTVRAGNREACPGGRSLKICIKISTLRNRVSQIIQGTQHPCFAVSSVPFFHSSGPSLARGSDMSPSFFWATLAGSPCGVHECPGCNLLRAWPHWIEPDIAQDLWSDERGLTDGQPW